MVKQWLVAAIVVGAVSGAAGTAWAAPIVVQVGDDDGYGGQGIADNGDMPVYLTGWDFRGAGEVGATNGAQGTDVFGAFDSFSGSVLPHAFDVIFPFTGTLVDGTLTIDMASLQSATFGDILATINGIPQPGMLLFHDSIDGNATRVRTFTLSAAAIAAANLAGQVVLRLDRGTSIDEVAYDYFRLNANVNQQQQPPPPPTVPEPGTLGLLALGGAWAIGRARRRRAVEEQR
jgi:hypothetical protein